MKPLLDVGPHRRAEHDSEDAAERMATPSRTNRCWLPTHGVWAASRDEIAGAYSGTNTPLSSGAPATTSPIVAQTSVDQ